MLRERNYILRQANIWIDMALGVAAFFVAHGLRAFGHFLYPDLIPTAPWTHYGWILFFLPILTVAVLGYNGFYQSHRLRLKIGSLIRTIAVSCLEIGVLSIVIIYLFWREALHLLLPVFGVNEARLNEEYLVSRPLLVLVVVVLFALLSIKTWLVRRLLMVLRESGYNFRRVVLVGSGEPLRRMIERLESHPIWGLKVEGIVSDDDGEGGSEAFGHPVIARLDDAAQALVHREVDEVVIVSDLAPARRLAPLMERCEEMGIRTHVPLRAFDGQVARPFIDRLDDLPVISYWPTREIGPALLFKYAFDRVFGAVLLVLLSPLLAAAALAIRLTSARGEPVFFGQTRCGLNGRKFTLWKFRTMRVGAEGEREELRGRNEADGPVFKMKDDPRVTPIGRFLRRFSVDELPQLWNVVRGEMSLVGPRPPLPEEFHQYSGRQRRRLSMKPGMTCLWQVSGRSRLTFETWIKLDLQYIDNWSLALDFKILMRTVFVVITGHGAM